MKARLTLNPIHRSLSNIHQYQHIRDNKSFLHYPPIKNNQLDSNIEYHPIQMIHKNRRNKYAKAQDSCPLQTIKKHINRSFQSSTNSTHKQNTKRQAYLFFQQEKRKKLQLIREENYLLPKLCRKSKKHFIYQNKENQKQQPILQKIHKQQLIPQSQQEHIDILKSNSQYNVLNNHKLIEQGNLYKNEPNQAGIIKNKFKNKIQSQLKKIVLNLPFKQDLMQKKCYFDLSPQEVQEIFFSNPSFPKLSMHHNEQKIMDNQNKAKELQTQQPKNNLKRKFKNIKWIQKQTIENNNSIPSFLLQRVSIKRHSSHHNISFLTQMVNDKMFFSPLKSKKCNDNNINQKLIPTSLVKLR